MSTIKGVDTLEDLKRFLGPGFKPLSDAPSVPPPSERAEKQEMVTPAVVLNGGVLVALVPVASASESNGRDWRARSKRSNAAWRAVSRTFGPHLDALATFASHYHAGNALRITFARLGGRKLDRGNIAAALKGCEDAVAFLLGADDGSPLWQADYIQHPGGPVGVRVEIEVIP